MENLKISWNFNVDFLKYDVNKQFRLYYYYYLCNSVYYCEKLAYIFLIIYLLFTTNSYIVK